MAQEAGIGMHPVPSLDFLAGTLYETIEPSMEP